MMDTTEIHNSSVDKIVADVVKPTLEAGGSPEDVLVLLEGVVAGVVLSIGKPGGDRAIVGALAAGVLERLAVMRPTYDRARTGLVAGSPSSGKTWRPNWSGKPT